MTLTKKYIVVTGGTGFIGSNIIKKLILNKYNIIVIDNNYRGNLGRLSGLKKKIKFLECDVRDKVKIFKIFTKFNINCVIHLAYINGTKNFYKFPFEIIDIATKGTLNMLEASVKHKVKKFFLASSSEVYSDPEILPTPEDIELKIPELTNPRYSYGGGKIISELLAYHYGKKYFKKMIIFRPHNVYSHDMGKDHVIPELFDKILKLKNKKKIKKIYIQGTGNETRAFTYIDDFVSGFEILFKKGRHLNVYNIGNDQETKIKDLVNIICDKLKVKYTIGYKKKFKGSPLRRCPDISKIRKLGFVPKTNIKKGIENIIKKL